MEKGVELVLTKLEQVAPTVMAAAESQVRAGIVSNAVWFILMSVATFFLLRTAPKWWKMADEGEGEQYGICSILMAFTGVCTLVIACINLDQLLMGIFAFKYEVLKAALALVK